MVFFSVLGVRDAWLHSAGSHNTPLTSYPQTQTQQILSAIALFVCAIVSWVNVQAANAEYDDTACLWQSCSCQRSPYTLHLVWLRCGVSGVTQAPHGLSCLPVKRRGTTTTWGPCRPPMSTRPRCMACLHSSRPSCSSWRLFPPAASGSPLTPRVSSAVAPPTP